MNKILISQFYLIIFLSFPVLSNYPLIEPIDYNLPECEYENNKVVTPLEMVDKMNYFPCINEYQIKQTRNGMLINLAGGNFSDDNNIKQSMMQILEGKQISEAKVEVVHVDSIERSGSGKLKQFIKLQY